MKIEEIQKEWFEINGYVEHKESAIVDFANTFVLPLLRFAKEAKISVICKTWPQVIGALDELERE